MATEERFPERFPTFPSGTKELEAFIAGETLGSIKYTALLDCAEYHKFLGKFHRLRTENADVKDISIIESSYGYAVLRETIRIRRFGKDGQAYSQAFREAVPVVNTFAIDYLDWHEVAGAEPKLPRVLNYGWEQGSAGLINAVEAREGIQQPVIL